MRSEKPGSELRRLQTEQSKTRHDEIFGGLSPEERAEYDRKADRIHKLESEIQASAGAKKEFGGDRDRKATLLEQRTGNRHSPS